MQVTHRVTLPAQIVKAAGGKVGISRILSTYFARRSHTVKHLRRGK
jgi:hypothetical protein